MAGARKGGALGPPAIVHECSPGNRKKAGSGSRVGSDVEIMPRLVVTAPLLLIGQVCDVLDRGIADAADSDSHDHFGGFRVWFGLDWIGLECLLRLRSEQSELFVGVD